MKKRLEYLLFFVAFLMISFLGIQNHRYIGYFNWKTEIWSDKAGYYVYLPSLFIYDFDASRFPEAMDQQTGDGFNLDLQNHKVRTKYTYGVSLMVSPFFLTAHLMAKVAGYPADGFSPIYQKILNVAAAFYVVLGLFLLRRFLRHYLGEKWSYLTILILFLATNLLYYTVDETMMSHAYSFFLFALFLFSLQKLLTGNRPQITWFFILSFSIAVITLIRPVNLLLILVLAFWNVASFKEFQARFKHFLKIRYILIKAGSFILVFLPQIIYWKYATGHFLHYSYGNEGFSNWTSPYLLEVWFAPLNGLFLYSPILLLMVAGLVWMIIRREPNGRLIAAMFLMVSYICAAWDTWYFGCSYGQRSFVEHLSLFSLPLGFFLKGIFSRRQPDGKILIGLLIIIFTYYNLRMSYAYEKCFFGSTWDWPQYSRQLASIGLFPNPSGKITFMNDTENSSLNSWKTLTREQSRSGMYANKVDENNEFCCQIVKKVGDLYGKAPYKVEVTAWVSAPIRLDPEIYLVCSIESAPSTPFLWLSEKIDTHLKNLNEWTEVTRTFELPVGLHPDYLINVYIWNQNREKLFVDDIKVSIE
ncbi:MAG: hypothetical protein FJY10_00225 [Bacteroidetes bacterium]|nr:hypothetical protein [Bacteroidota bacterium]